MRGPQPPDVPRRRLLAVVLAAAVLAATVLVATPTGAGAEDGLKQAREELQQTKDRIRARAAKMRALQRDMNRIATRIATTQDRIHRAIAQQRTLAGLALANRRLAQDHASLREKMAESRDLTALLQERKHDVLWTISRIHPFAVCPVQGPHAVSNSFGIWVHRSKKRGGDHVHQGNDITAPYGTPIVAPFDGVASIASNKIGGLAVKVFGDFGFVYNAHLSRIGRLGSVDKGDVVGYVGATGNAGGPHDHFEWHPGNGSAVDPYPFLMQVC